MSKGSVRRPGKIPAGAWEAIFEPPAIEPPEPCSDCGGTGRKNGQPCSVCAPTDDGPGDVGIPISKFAAQSQENAALVEQLHKGLADGSISMCACMGPVGDDPYCPCDMRRRGLVPTNPWTPEKIAELHRVLDKYSPERIDATDGGNQ
jgi:hypothetical protein